LAAADRRGAAVHPEVGNPLAAADRQRIAEAIAAAERNTAGEIRVVLATHPLTNTHVYPVLWAALAALALPWLFVLFQPLPVIVLFGAQIVLFALVALVLTRPGLWRAVTPLRAREHAAREMALTQFLGLGIHETRDRTGVLILIALADRVAEVVGDQKIHGCVGHEAWQAVCTHVVEGGRSGQIAEGIIAGIGETGRLLAEHFPPRPDNANELPDHLVIV
jgi:putative membrane protein